MATASIGTNRVADPLSPASNGVVSHAPDVKFDEPAGLIRVRDRRMFQTGHRSFCRRLVESLARRHGVQKAEIDLASATCRVDFGQHATTSLVMAKAFADSLHETVSSPLNGRHFSWWPDFGAGWTKLTAYPLQNDVSVWETLEIKPGQIRIRNQRFVTELSADMELAERLSHLAGVESCHVLPWSDALTIHFRADCPFADRVLDEVESHLQDLIAAKAVEHGATALAGLPAVAGDPPKVATGSKRIINLVLAGGSFVLTGVALVVPGIPFLPFLLATSYYLARSSPWMDQKLRRLPLIGAVLVEWEQYGRLSRLSKLKLVGLTIVVIGLSVVVVGLSPVALVVVFLISCVMIFGILHAPEIEDGAHTGLTLDQPVRLALPAP